MYICIYLLILLHNKHNISLSWECYYIIGSKSM